MELSLEKIRENMKQSRSRFTDEGHCVLELAKFATNTTIMGFEDPRSYADDLLIKANISISNNPRVECERVDCDVFVNYNRTNDTFDVEGSCPLEETCTKEVWNDDDEEHKYERLTKVSLRRAVDEQIGFICARNSCDYNCGYTSTSQGENGVCAREQE
jgi:hypothetical protein